jgi:hypothetical protein
MDLFFGTVSSLLSLLMRSIIENTLNDLVAFLSNYKNGNNFNNDFTIFSTSQLVLPFKCYLLPNRDQGLVKIDPDFDETFEIINQTIDEIAESLNDMPRIEKLLFHETQGVEYTYYNMVRKNEELVIKYKNILKEIITSNSIGPIL